MTIRLGESWTARNGHRRWVSMSLGTWLRWHLFMISLRGRS